MTTCLWQLGVCRSPTDSFAHVSFVNGVSTPRGGTHLEHATRALMAPLLKQLAAKLKAPPPTHSRHALCSSAIGTAYGSFLF